MTDLIHGDIEDASAPDINENEVLNLWAEALGVSTTEVELDKTFFELGGYSLLAVRLAKKVSDELDIDCSPVSILTHSRFSDFFRYLKRKVPTGASSNAVELEVKHDKTSQNEKFILTDLQQAYWLGEKQGSELGGAGTWFCEYESNEFDSERFKNALDQLVIRHPALRTVFDENAYQRVLPESTSIPFLIEDISSFDRSEQEARIQEIRALNQTSKNCIGLDKPHLTSISVVKSSERFHIFMNGRLIVTDGRSGEIFAEDLWQLYQGKALKPLQLTVKDYITFLDQSRKTNDAAKREYQEALEYWEARVPNMSNAPDIPRRSGENNNIYPMSRLSYRLPKEKWSSFKKKASEKGLTPTTAICSVFSHLLSYWSGDKKFSLNVMYGNRQPYHEDVNEIVGCLSHTLLLEVDLSQESFAGNTQALQTQLFSDMEHWRVSGIEVLRKLAQYRADSARAPLMPIVFASGLGLASEEEKPFFMERFGWKSIDSGIQTPHVLLDHQIAESNGQLMIQWDVREKLFPASVPKDMFDTYCQLLEQLCQDDIDIWDNKLPLSLPDHQKLARDAANFTTGIDLPYRFLHEGFFAHYKSSPNNIALHHDGVDWTYRDLHDKVQRLLGNIKASDISVGSNIGIMMEKGPGQVASTLAVLAAGCVYVPISTEQPEQRIQQIVDACGIELLLFQPSARHQSISVCKHIVTTNDLKEQPEVTYEIDNRRRPDDLAYIIFTSGTTGVPKGVAISHRGALNTIVDINHRFGIDNKDVVLGVSELNFDLSVYDIFGTFIAGGTLVVPLSEHSKNPIYLTNTIADQSVTVWNSVPAFLEMLVEYCEVRKLAHLRSLKKIMLSGDWVPLNLYDRVKALNNDFQFICMGGATEASIWSNFHVVESVPNHWTSIPYGRPLANQTYHVLDSDYRDAPDWVAGEIHIGGVGLAKEYYGDSNKTDAAFINHPDTGTRLYKTGDWGRYWPDGTLEFLGRRDSQIKVRGHRIELGEIEAGLRRLDCVKETIALSHSVGGSNSIFAFVIPSTEGILSSTVLEQLIGEVPSYMIPSGVILLDRFPVTPNRKIDRKALISMIGQAAAADIGKTTPTTPIQRSIIALWEEILNIKGITLDSNFFSLGGDSISVIRMLNQVNALIGEDIDASAFYLYPTVENLSEVISAKGAALERDSEILVPLAKGDELPPLFCIHPIGGNVFCYRHLASMWQGDVYGLKAKEIDEDFSGVWEIGDMAKEYAEAISHCYPIGTVYLLGWSMGGLIAMEVSRLLIKQNRDVKVVMLDTWVKRDVVGNELLRDSYLLRDFFSDLNNGLSLNAAELESDSVINSIQKGLSLTGLAEQIDIGIALSLYRVFKNNALAIQDYDPYTNHAAVLTIVASREDIHRFSRLSPITKNDEWMEAIPNSQTISVDEDHFSIVSDSSIEQLFPNIVKFFTKEVGNE